MSLPIPAAPGNGAVARQPTLFQVTAYGDVCVADPCAARHRGAETSIQAHERIKPHKRAIHEKITSAKNRKGISHA